VNLIDHWLDPEQEALLQGPRNALLKGQAKVITSQQNLEAASNDAEGIKKLAGAVMTAYNGRGDLIKTHLQTEAVGKLAESNLTVLNLNFGNGDGGVPATSILLPQGGGGQPRSTNEPNTAAA
jgi:hypothetical protein